MTTTLVRCDRCSAEIAADRARLVLEGGPPSSPLPADPSTGRPSLDLCGLCLGKLGSWLAEGPASDAKRAG